MIGRETETNIPMSRKDLTYRSVTVSTRLNDIKLFL